MFHKLAIAGTALLAWTGAASAATYTFSFNGFCDGMSLTINGAAVAGVSTGCYASNPDAGRVTKPLKGTGQLLVVGSSNLAVLNNDPKAVVVYVIDLVHQHWSLFKWVSPTQEQLLNSGTLTFGPVAESSYKKRSTDQ